MNQYMGREMVKKSRIIREKVFLILIIIMAIYLETIAMGAQVMKEAEVYYECVMIHSGDTLWGIAERYKRENEETERMIYDIMKLNGMRSENIESGESIIVPIKKEKNNFIEREI